MKRTFLWVAALTTSGAWAHCDHSPREVAAKRIGVAPQASGLNDRSEEATSMLELTVDDKVICSVKFSTRDEMVEKLNAAHAFLARARKAGTKVKIQGAHLGPVLLSPSDRRHPQAANSEAAPSSH